MMAATEELHSTGRAWSRSALTAESLSGIENFRTVSSTRFTALPKAVTASLETIASQYLPSARIVRLTLFNKSPDHNWSLPWHQDRVIAVKDRHEVPGFINWTRKDSYWHCEPPRQILEDMMFARIYLDDTDVIGGDLEMALKSHSFGKIVAGDIPDRLINAKLKDVWVSAEISSF